MSIKATAVNTKTASATISLRIPIHSTASNTKSASAAFTQKLSIKATAVNTLHATGSFGASVTISSTAVNTPHATAAIGRRQPISSIAFNVKTATAVLGSKLTISAIALNTPVADASFEAPPRPPQHLGGTVTLLELGGSITVAPNLFGGSCAVDVSFGGSVVVATLDGSITIPSYGGTATVVNDFGGNIVLAAPGLGGAAEEWTMQEVDITFNEFNDMTCALTITKNSAAYNLTGIELDMFLKTAAGVPDSDPSVVKLSTTTGEITITNAAGGLATAVVPDADNSGTTIAFYRVDAVDGSGLRNTALFGKVTIIPL
jgi:hypothetical protein